jgi:CheY-like chemotaxis protein
LLKISNYLPDLVLTDLQMPELDGLELVNRIVERFPDLPVVLMTAHGSENIAAQALANGAASFVPKSELAQSLVDTVRQILSIASAESRHKRLKASIKSSAFEFELANDPELIPPVLDLVQQLLVNNEHFDHSARMRIGVALEQALLNSMVRGNLELSRALLPVHAGPMVHERNSNDTFSERRVNLNICVTPDQVKIHIRDQGPGFDLSMVPEPCAAEGFQDGHGRGLVLMTSFMDEVNFSDSGREVVMVKHSINSPMKPR